MDLTLTEDQELIRTTAVDVLAARRGSAGFRAMADDPTGYSTGLWKELVELGWTSLALPEAYGGVGAGFLEVCLLVEQLGRFGVPSPYLSTVVCAALPIVRFGTPDQKAAWLGGIARGRVVSYARAAPEGRWDATGADVVATDTAGGYVLDGTAMFVPYAHAADDLLVVARRPGPGAPGDLTVLLVDAAAPGIVREPLDVIDADRAHRVDFDGVAVPGGHALGGVDGGRPVVDAITAHATAATCAEMVGGAQAVLDMTVGYAVGREQFGRRIGSFQAVAHHCANMAVDVLSSRFIAYEAIWRLSEGLGAAVEVSAAKAWVSEAYQRVCALGHQVHGAVGFTQEHDLHFYTRHAVASALSFGDGDFHTERVARHLGL